jgi:hypothetical protein
MFYLEHRLSPAISCWSFFRVGAVCVSPLACEEEEQVRFVIAALRERMSAGRVRRVHFWERGSVVA